MMGRWNEAVASVNAYAKGMRNAEGAKIGFATLDSPAVFEIVRQPTLATEWVDVPTVEFGPRGGTPLYDAIAKFVAWATEINDPKTVLIIITDGEENASVLHNKNTAKGLLDLCRSRGWEVQFLGVDFDNFAQATSLGNQRGSTISTAQGHYNTAMNMMAGRSASYAAGASFGGDWTEQERAAAEGKAKPNGQSGSGS